MSDYRKHMGPEKLQALMILKDNYDLWGNSTKGPRLIQKIMNAEKKRKAEEDAKDDDYM